MKSIVAAPSPLHITVIPVRSLTPETPETGLNLRASVCTLSAFEPSRFGICFAQYLTSPTSRFVNNFKLSRCSYPEHSQLRHPALECEYLASAMFISGFDSDSSLSIHRVIFHRSVGITPASPMMTRIAPTAAASTVALTTIWAIWP